MGVKLPQIASGEITLRNKLSMSVLEWEVSPVCCKIHVTKELEARESRDLLVGLRLKSKSHCRKTDFCSLDILLKNLFRQLVLKPLSSTEGC